MCPLKTDTLKDCASVFFKKYVRVWIGYLLIFSGLFIPIDLFSIWFSGDDQIEGRVLFASLGILLIVLSKVKRIKFGPVELQLLKNEIDKLNQYTRHSLRLWIYFLKANKEMDAKRKADANQKFQEEINKLIQEVLPEKEERIRWIDDSIE